MPSVDTVIQLIGDLSPILSIGLVVFLVTVKLNDIIQERKQIKKIRMVMKSFEIAYKNNKNPETLTLVREINEANSNDAIKKLKKILVDAGHDTSWEKSSRLNSVQTMLDYIANDSTPRSKGAI